MSDHGIGIAGPGNLAPTRPASRYDPRMADQTEPRDAARLLQILTAEHASLTAMRTQAQSEMASRATMFVAALSGGLVAISFIAQATRFGPE